MTCRKMGRCSTALFLCVFFTGLQCVCCYCCISNCNPSAFIAAGAEIKAEPVQVSRGEHESGKRSLPPAQEMHNKVLMQLNHNVSFGAFNHPVV